MQCQRGTDCDDCGVRTQAPPPPPRAPPPPKPPTGMGVACSDQCLMFKANGVCEDGGPGAEFAICHYGTDCTDCGHRLEVIDGGIVACSNQCTFKEDGLCDDGGKGATFSLCRVGSDCADCGGRYMTKSDAQRSGAWWMASFPPPPPLPHYLICANTCTYANDGRCQDGAFESGSPFPMCEHGTDCTDCGPRYPTPSPPPPPPPPPPPRKCGGWCAGVYSMGDRWTREERACNRRCPENADPWWNFGQYYFSAGGMYHNCLCDGTRLPGNVNTKCTYTPGAVAGGMLCCNGQCYKSGRYEERKPPPPPPPIWMMTEEYKLSQQCGSTRHDCWVGSNGRIYYYAPPPPYPPGGGASNDPTIADCNCVLSKQCYDDKSCINKDMDRDGDTDCDDCMSGYGQAGFCSCCHPPPPPPPPPPRPTRSLDGPRDYADLACDVHGALNDPLGQDSIGLDCDNGPWEQVMYGDDHTCRRRLAASGDDRRKMAVYDERYQRRTARRRRMGQSFSRIWSAEAGALAVAHAHHPQNLTLHEAQRACEEDEGCAGYMYAEPQWLRDPDERAPVHLARKSKRSADLGSIPNGDFGWTTHLKQTTQQMMAEHFWKPTRSRTWPILEALTAFPKDLEEMAERITQRMLPLLAATTRHHDDFTELLDGDSQAAQNFLHHLMTLNETLNGALHESEGGTHGQMAPSQRAARRLGKLSTANAVMGAACTGWDTYKKCEEAGCAFCAECGSAVAQGLLDVVAGVSIADGMWDCMTGGDACPGPNNEEETQTANCLRLANS